MATAKQSFEVMAEDAGVRLDVFLTARLEEVSRSRVQQLIAQEKVLVNGAPERSSYKVQPEDEIKVIGPALPPPLRATPENIPLDVVYEDDSLAVINKPAGMIVHAGAGTTGDDEESDPRNRGTLVNALLYRFRKLSGEGGELRPGIVHRLDKDTSGLIIVAKTDIAHRRLAEAFAERRVKKTYLALVHGWPRSESGTIDAAIGRDMAHRHRMSARSRDGRSAVTHYKVLREFTTAYGKFALLEVKIETGRTHQIRVHLASIGNPVVGDTLYGAPGELSPLAGAMQRAKRADTKATRDRAASDLARLLTEEAMSGDKRKAKRTKVKSSGDQEISTSSNAPALRLPRNFLHAAMVEFVHPKSGKEVSLRSDVPPQLAEFLGELTGADASKLGI
jgi:23S rRNA pseudouridine1911/1915/1917 synthase